MLLGADRRRRVQPAVHVWHCRRVTASRGSLIMALIPAATLLGGALFLHEPLTRRRVAWASRSRLLGVAVELGRRQSAGALHRPRRASARLRLFGCVLAWAAYTLIGKRMLDGSVAACRDDLCGADRHGCSLVAVAVATGDLVRAAATSQGWVALAFLGLLGTAIAYVWFYEGVQGDRTGALGGLHQPGAGRRDHAGRAAAGRAARRCR